MKKNNFLTKAFTLLFVLLFNLTGARAIVTHTVYQNGTVENSIVPVQGGVVGTSLIRSQFIIPKSQLEIMAGGEISNMIFYTIPSQAVVNWYREANFRVYVKEVDQAVFTQTGNGNNRRYTYQDWDNLTEVYYGNLAVNGNQLIVDFNSNIPYTGNGNLLIGIYQTSTNSNGTSTFYGEEVTGASLGSTGDNNPTQQNFVPRTTFVYTPGFIPTNVNAVATQTTTEETIAGTHPQIVNATVSWTGNADSYEIRYRTKRPLFKETFDSGIPSSWTILKGDDAYGNGWISYSNAVTSYSWNSDGHWTSWQNPNDKRYHADNWLISPAVELGGILKFDVGISAWHDIYEVRVSTTGIAETDFTEVVRELTPGLKGTEDFDLEAYQGQTGYIAIHHKNYDGYYLNIDNFELSSGHKWKKVTTTEKSVVLPRLTPYMEYEYVVVGIKHDNINNVDVRGETHNLTFQCPGAADIILPDDEDNEDLIYDVAGLNRSFNAYLENRTFMDNGIWNTLSLPFDVTVANSPFSDAAIYTVLNRSSVVNGLLTLRIDPLTPITLKAGTPYLVTWEGAKGLEEPVFSQVTFKNETNEVTGSVTGGTTIVFKPNFNYLDFEAADPSVLFLSNNNLYSAGKGAKIKPQRGYFQTSDGSPVRGMVFDIVDEETAIESVNGAFNNNPWYDLNGRKLTGKPVQKGIYINNGKKTIIK